jgi:hypothetical protein
VGWLYGELTRWGSSRMHNWLLGRAIVGLSNPNLVEREGGRYSLMALQLAALPCLVGFLLGDLPTLMAV